MYNDVFSLFMNVAVTKNGTINSTTSSSTIDTQSTTNGNGDGYVNVRVEQGATTGSGTLTVSIQESDDDSTYADIPTNSAYTSTCTLSTATDNTVQYIRGQRSKRYVKIKYTLSGTNSTAGINTFYMERKSRTQA